MTTAAFRTASLRPAPGRALLRAALLPCHGLCMLLVLPANPRDCAYQEDRMPPGGGRA